MTLTIDQLPRDGYASTIALNASGLKISACRRRWFMTCVLGLKEPGEDPILKVGKIVHKFAESVNLKRGDAEAEMTAMRDALQAAANLPTKEKDQVKAAISACPTAQLSKPLLIAGTQGAEYKFNFPVDERQGWRYVGTMDLLSHDLNRNILVIEDYKTSRKYVFKDVISGYFGDPQFTFYPFILQHYAYEIFKGDLAMGNLAWYRNFVMRVVAVLLSVKPVAWRRGPEWSYSAERLERFEDMVIDFIDEMTPFVAERKLPPPNGMLINACPSCPFKELCFAEREVDLAAALPVYKVEKYDPLNW